MRSCPFVLLALALTPLAATAQDADPGPAPAPTPSISLTIGGLTGLPRLGVWKPLTDRLSLGLEVESDVMSSTFFPNGDQSRGVHRRYWRFAFGPTASFRLAGFESLSLLAYAGASYGVQAFDVAGPAENGLGLGDRGYGVRVGFGIDWHPSDHWTLGATYLSRWTSAPGLVDGGTRPAWRGPMLGISLKFHF